jgi:hypothetical protein
MFSFNTFGVRKSRIWFLSIPLVLENHEYFYQFRIISFKGKTSTYVLRRGMNTGLPASVSSIVLTHFGAVGFGIKIAVAMRNVFPNYEGELVHTEYRLLPIFLVYDVGRRELLKQTSGC